MYTNLALIHVTVNKMNTLLYPRHDKSSCMLVSKLIMNPMRFFSKIAFIVPVPVIFVDYEIILRSSQMSRIFGHSDNCI